jgi:hypothetical protein
MNGEVQFKADAPSDGGPAYPVQGEFFGEEFVGASDGMSMLDRLAIAALPIVANGSYVQGNDFLHRDHFASVARDAYEFAVEMLKARARATGSTGGAQ